MSVAEQPIAAKGVWGPYKGALFPNMYLHEAGQSATGILLDFIVERHPAYATILENTVMHPQQYLNELLQTMANEENLSNVHELTRDVHIWPDFHGNRSPVSDASLRGMVSFKFSAVLNE